MEMIRVDAGKRAVVPVNFVNADGLRVYPAEVYLSVTDVDGNEVVPRHEFDPMQGNYVLTKPLPQSDTNTGGTDPGEAEGQEPEPEPEEPEDGEAVVEMATAFFMPPTAAAEPGPVWEFPMVDPYDPMNVPGTKLVILESDLIHLKDSTSGKSEGLIVVVDGIDKDGLSFEYEFMVSIRADLTVPWVTSCDTYRRMMLAISDFPIAKTADLLAMEKLDRQNALVDSFHAIMSLPLRVRAEGKYKGKPFAQLATEERLEVIGMDPRFAAAMLKAQVLEACSSSDQDPVAQARNNGIISMTVGESSQFYGSSKTLQSTTQVTSKDAMNALGPWLDFSVRLGRA